MGVKNFEAYESKIKELGGVFALTENDEIVPCDSYPCLECKFYVKDINCSEKMFNWLYEEYKDQKNGKVLIPKGIRIILESLDDKWCWIAKDENGAVFCYDNKPKKDVRREMWDNSNPSLLIDYVDIFDESLFNFLSWEDEEPTNIKELLENCEVIE